MNLSISWPPRARQDFAEILTYLEKEWERAVAIKFLDHLEETLETISRNPDMFPKYIKEENIHRCVLVKQVILYYRRVEG